jgi:hypothetical protein
MSHVERLLFLSGRKKPTLLGETKLMFLELRRAFE